MNLPQMTDILLAALTVELRRDGTDQEICSFTKQPGDSVVTDYADCGGMAWVRHVTTTASIGFPNADVTADSCYWGLAHTIEMGVMRTSPIPTETLSTVEPPSEEELSAAADAQYRDMAAMHRAILAARRDIELLPGTYSPVGPMGGVVGGTWSLLLAEE